MNETSAHLRRGTARDPMGRAGSGPARAQRRSWKTICNPSSAAPSQGRPATVAVSASLPLVDILVRLEPSSALGAISLQSGLGTRLDWIAVDHHNTSHPHTRIPTAEAEANYYAANEHFATAG